MKKARYLVLYFLLSFVCGLQATDLFSLQNPKLLDRPLIMTGMGLERIQNDDYYIGVFFLDKNIAGASPADVVFTDETRRMEIKIASSRSVSGRAFARKLAGGIRINNERAALDDPDHKRQLKRFIGLFNGSYKKGDILRFDYHRNFGTRVSLNGRVLGEIAQSSQLYGFLINIWIGERPPSSSFKSGIMGLNNDKRAIELQNYYLSL